MRRRSMPGSRPRSRRSFRRVRSSRAAGTGRRPHDLHHAAELRRAREADRGLRQERPGVSSARAVSADDHRLLGQRESAGQLPSHARPSEQFPERRLLRRHTHQGHGNSSSRIRGRSRSCRGGGKPTPVTANASVAQPQPGRMGHIPVVACATTFPSNEGTTERISHLVQPDVHQLCRDAGRAEVEGVGGRSVAAPDVPR